MFNVKTLPLTNDKGNRAVAVTNQVRAQMKDKIMAILSEAGFDVCVAANGDIAFPTAIDSATGKTYYTRLAMSFTDRDLDSVTAKRTQKAAPATVVSLFADEE